MSLGHGAKVVQDGLVLHLDAANPKSYPGTGNTLFDLSGNSNHGTLTNDPIYDSGNKGSIVFDGINDAISISNITLTSGITFISWIYINGPNSNFGSIFANWGSGGNAYWIGTYINNSQNIEVYFNNVLVSTITSLNLNTWMMLSVTNTGNVCKGYINTVEKFSLSSTLISSTNITSIGYDITRTNYPFKGDISQASIYNRALSSAEIKQNFEATRGRYGV